jgi:hypothetical protein
MPMNSEWVMPEVFLVHKEVTVYHTYKEDDVSQGVNMFWYTLDPYSDEGHFDARDLPDGTFHEECRVIVVSAIDAGLLVAPEVD